MPRSIVLEDGSQIEVPTDEELNALKTTAETAAKTAAELKAEIEKRDNDPVEKNWRLIREKNEKLTQQLLQQGKHVADDGSITDAPKALTAEEIEQKARSAARAELLSSQKNARLSKYDQEKRQVVEHYFKKLTAGEEVTGENFDKFFQEAEILADPAAASRSDVRRVSPTNGQPPVFKTKDEDSFANSDAGKAIADEVFGGLSYTKVKK